MKTKAFAKIVALVLAFLMLLSVLTVVLVNADEKETSAAALKLYVAVDGDDSADGTEAHPLASLEGARDKIRAIKAESGLPTGGIDVYFKEGTYYLDHEVKMSYETNDGGSEDCPIRFIGVGDVTFSGGYTLDNSDFKQVTDEAVLDRLDESARESVYEYDLTILDEIGIDWGRDYEFQLDQREYPFESILFVNSEMYCLARYPNADVGFATILDAYKASDDENDQTYWIEIDEEAGKILSEWDFSQELRNAGYYIQTYLYEESQIYAIENRDGHYWVLMEHPDPVLYSRPILADRGATRICFYNGIEALDTVGEYYIDKKTAKLYVIPCEGFDEAEIVVPVLQDQNMIGIEYANYLTFDNINFKYGWHDALGLTSESTTVKNCEICCFFGNGIIGVGRDYTIDGNVIHDVGLRCLYLNSNYYSINHQYQDKSQITNNEFYKWAMKDTWCIYAISLDFGGMRVANNYFHDAKFGAIGASTDCLIEYNVFTRLNTEVYDDGAIHSGVTERGGGSIVRYNYIYDCYCNGIYWDNWGTNQEIYGNIIVNIGNGIRHVVQGFGIIINGGYNCRIENNIIVNCSSASISFCSRIMWPSLLTSYSDILSNRYLPEAKMIVPTMLLVNPNLRGVAEPDCVDSVGYLVVQNNVAYSETKQYKQYEGYILGTTRSYDGKRGISEEFKDAGAVFRNNTLSDVYPEFANPGGDIADPSSYNLSDTSSIYSLLPGFTRIPVEKIGIGNYDK